MEIDFPNIRQCAAVAAVAQTGTVTGAAQRIHLTQPALTQAIARLEKELGCRLFDRSASGMTPTEPGALLAPRCERAIEHIGNSRVTGPQMRALVMLARHGSYAAAAEASGLAMASVHRAVGDLSLVLGRVLVERRGRGVALTAAGERARRAFGLALAELRAGLEEVARWQGRRAGLIVIGAMPLSRAQWLPRALHRFTADHPDVALRIIEGSHAEMAVPLRDGEIDMMLGALRDDAPDGLEQRPAFTDRPRLIARTGHPAFAGDGPSPAQLARLPWILPGRETPLRRYWEAMLREVGIEPPDVSIECGSVLTIRELMLSSDAITLLSPSQLRVEIEAGLFETRPPPAAVLREIGITVRTGWFPTAPQAALIDHLMAVSEEID